MGTRTNIGTLLLALSHNYMVILVVAMVTLGAVFSITGSIQTISGLLCTVALSEVYRPELLVRGRVENPGIPYWILTALWAASIPPTL